MSSATPGRERTSRRHGLPEQTFSPAGVVSFHTRAARRRTLAVPGARHCAILSPTGRLLHGPGMGGGTRCASGVERERSRMLTSLPHVYYVFLQVGVVVILLAALAVMVTARTGSGVALAVLLALVAAAYVAGIISNARVVADPDTYFASRSHPFGGVWTAITEAADLGLFCVAGGAALASTALARHWRWFAGIFAALVPMA